MTTHSRGIFDELLADGWPRVVRLKAEGEAESVRLDFKEVKPTAVPSQEGYIKEKFARALSGFANTDGGVLVYGIKTNDAPKGTPDRAQDIVEIENAAAFRADLDRLASRVVEPLVPAVEIKEIEKPGAGGRGVVAVYVPKSPRGPHRVVDTNVKGTDDHYYGRVATEFDVIPHNWLAALFAYQSPARLEFRAMFVGPVEDGKQPVVELRLLNRGRRTAKAPSVLLPNPPPLHWASAYVDRCGLTWDTLEDGTQCLHLQARVAEVVYGGRELLLLRCRVDSRAYTPDGDLRLVFNARIASLETESFDGTATLFVAHHERGEAVMFERRAIIGG
jgi:hypothetical protein